MQKPNSPTIALLPTVLLAACSPPNGQPGAASAVAETAPAAEAAILIRSSPSAGSTVRAPVDELKLEFDPPARLGEVIVTGPGGAMPMMISAIGEVRSYSLPLDGLGPGSYKVDWRASAQGRDYRGEFTFTVTQ